MSHLVKRIILILYILCSPCFSYGGAKKIYVSTSGVDNNPGSQRLPLATLSKAIERANYEWDRNHYNGAINIVLGEGVYYQGNPVVINTIINKDHNSILTIEGKGVGKTILTGGIELPTFEKDDATGLWCVSLNKDLVEGGVLNQLFVNGKRATLARTPNLDDYFIPQKAEEKAIDTDNNRYLQTIYLQNNSLLKSLNQNNKIIVSILHYWDLTRKFVKTINADSNSFCIEGESIKRWYYFSPQYSAQLYFENAFSFLDAPGEYFYDKNTGNLYYYPREYESLKDTKAIIPLQDCLFKFTGTSDNPVNNIILKDLSISYTAYSMPPDGENPQQAVASKEAVVMLDYAKDVHFKDCEFSHVGLNCIWFRTGCSDCSIERCYLHDMGTGGVKIGVTSDIGSDNVELTKRVIVNNNIIKEGGRILTPAEGITLFKASDCTISHNEVVDFYYTGISVGWTWGFGVSPTKRNTISYNHIHHIGWGAHSDIGGIYTLGKSEGTVINNNIIHDIFCYGADGNGLYLDEGTSGVHVYKNIVYGCKSKGLGQHYGRDNIIDNNIFAYNNEAQLGMGKAKQDDNTMLFKSNIIITSSNNRLFSSENWGNYPMVDSDYNLYWAENGDNSFCGLNIEEWRIKKNKDLHSIIVNPSVELVTQRYLRVKNKEAMKKISFSPIDCQKVGVYGDVEWRNLSGIEEERIFLFDSIRTNYYKDDSVSGVSKSSIGIMSALFFSFISFCFMRKRWRSVNSDSRFI